MSGAADRLLEVDYWWSRYEGSLPPRSILRVVSIPSKTLANYFGCATTTVNYTRMPQFVSERAESIRTDPTDGSSVQLVVRVHSDSMRAVTHWVAAHDGDSIDSLDHGLLEIALPEVHVSALCELGYVLSVECTDEAIGVGDQSN